MNDRETAILSHAEIANALVPYAANPLSAAQLAQISMYLTLLKKWCQVVPLTSVEDDSEIIVRHFGESIFAGSLLPMNSGRLADVGSGAGFPGIPLKIAFPALQVSLIEPNLKKCAFLRDVCAALRLPDIEIARSRYEDLHAPPNSFDFICSRALGRYRQLLQWARTVLKAEGHVILWLGVDDSNLIYTTKGWQWQLPAKIPESRRRVVLVGRSS